MSSSGNAGLRLSMSMLLLTALCAGEAVVVPTAVGAGPVARTVAAKVRLERPSTTHAQCAKPDT